MGSALIRIGVSLLLSCALLAPMSWAQTAVIAARNSGGSDAGTRPAPKFDVANIDRSLDPCVDFYQYACANWIKNNPIPPDYPEWVSFNEVYEHNLGVLHDILEKASVNDPKRSPVLGKIGDFYASCMDEKAANQKRFAPLMPELDRIAAVKSVPEMMEVISRQQLMGPNPLLGFGASPDLHNADMTQAFIDQNGLSLQIGRAHV